MTIHAAALIAFGLGASQVMPPKALLDALEGPFDPLPEMCGYLLESSGGRHLALSCVRAALQAGRRFRVAFSSDDGGAWIAYEMDNPGVVTKLVYRDRTLLMGTLCEPFEVSQDDIVRCVETLPPVE